MCLRTRLNKVEVSAINGKAGKLPGKKNWTADCCE
jgi:hypothetical protein